MAATSLIVVQKKAKYSTLFYCVFHQHQMHYTHKMLADVVYLSLDAMPLVRPGTGKLQNFSQEVFPSLWAKMVNSTKTQSAIVDFQDCRFFQLV